MSRIVWAMCGWHLNYEGKHIHYEFPSKWKMLSLITRGKGEESLMIHVFLGKRYPPSSLPARTFYPLPPALNYSIFFSSSKNFKQWHTQKHWYCYFNHCLSLFTAVPPYLRGKDPIVSVAKNVCVLPAEPQWCTGEEITAAGESTRKGTLISIMRGCSTD